ncbi:MAG: helix-turn-helix transcriptional regulator [Bacteroidetes bacterium]|jgi:AraC-like DNA-binding protein|nr:helix-turn-helix transcriptional regulator [Bacteroidota bacterium]
MNEPYINHEHIRSLALGLKISTREEAVRKIEQALSYIHSNWNRSLSIKEIARHVSSGESRFHFLFKALTGRSPYEYITCLKMEKALELQQSSLYTWTEIAELCAYTDISAFSKQFKKHYGVSPKNFR